MAVLHEERIPVSLAADVLKSKYHRVLTALCKNLFLQACTTHTQRIFLAWITFCVTVRMRIMHLTPRRVPAIVANNDRSTGKVNRWYVQA